MKNKKNINLNVFYSTPNLFQTSCFKVAVCCRNVFAVTADVSLEHDQENYFQQKVSEKLLPSLKVKSFLFSDCSALFISFLLCSLCKSQINFDPAMCLDCNIWRV